MYAGTEFVLNISISFSGKSLIDVGIIYTFVFSRINMRRGEQAHIIVNDDRIQVYTDNKLGMASLTYSPIAITDSGWITVTVTVSPCNNSLVQPITSTSSYSLHVEGIESCGSLHFMMCIDDMLLLDRTVPNVTITGTNVTISGPTTATAGEQLVLTCTVRVVEHLVSVPSVEWSGGSVGRGDGVVVGNTTHDGVISKTTLTFSPLHTSHGALYTCMADIQSINLTMEDVYLVVQCK